ncbi:MAG: alpha/beta fold hydrolase [Deltaproteobacteria bacterium]|nr:alpha/beta fold hydrolase [Deltaproteobacteria bacterium]
MARREKGDRWTGKLIRSVKRLNARLLPPETYRDTISLGLSAVEEAYFVVKNFVDGSIHFSGRVLYEDDYHERRLAEYGGQRRLLVFVPGYMQTPVCFYRLERFLGIELFDAFTYTWSDFPYSQDLTLSAEQLEAVLRDLVGRTRVREAFLVGHSQGGMIIRAMVQHGLGSDLPVRKCLFLSSPHQGTWAALAAVPHRGLLSMASLLPYIRKVQGESGLQLMPGSDFLRELNSRPLPDHVRFYSVYYSLDPMIWPPSHAIMPYPEAENHYIAKVGHAQPLYCSRAARVAIRALYGDLPEYAAEGERLEAELAHEEEEEEDLGELPPLGLPPIRMPEDDEERP